PRGGARRSRRGERRRFRRPVLMQDAAKLLDRLVEFRLLGVVAQPRGQAAQIQRIGEIPEIAGTVSAAETAEVLQVGKRWVHYSLLEARCRRCSARHQPVDEILAL